MIAIETAYFDSAVTANKAYIKLRDNIESFEKEALLIDEAKCYLINYGNLDDFEYDDAYIYETGDGYHISYSGLEIDLHTDDKMILDYDFE